MGAVWQVGAVQPRLQRLCSRPCRTSLPPFLHAPHPSSPSFPLCLPLSPARWSPVESRCCCPAVATCPLRSRQRPGLPTTLLALSGGGAAHRRCRPAFISSSRAAGMRLRPHYSRPTHARLPSALVFPPPLLSPQSACQPAHPRRLSLCPDACTFCLGHPPYRSASL